MDYAKYQTLCYNWLIFGRVQAAARKMAERLRQEETLQVGLARKGIHSSLILSIYLGA